MRRRLSLDHPDPAFSTRENRDLHVHDLPSAQVEVDRHVGLRVVSRAGIDHPRAEKCPGVGDVHSHLRSRPLRVEDPDLRWTRSETARTIIVITFESTAPHLITGVAVEQGWPCESDFRF